tara:strand:+ start:4798 stop:5349 length:552 start_codon:yes stop_codon:yes gene_type:complete
MIDGIDQNNLENTSVGKGYCKLYHRDMVIDAITKDGDSTKVTVSWNHQKFGFDNGRKSSVITVHANERTLIADGHQPATNGRVEKLVATAVEVHRLVTQKKGGENLNIKDLVDPITFEYQTIDGYNRFPDNRITQINLEAEGSEDNYNLQWTRKTNVITSGPSLQDSSALTGIIMTLAAIALG